MISKGIKLLFQRRIPFVQQTSSWDCGSACLAMILKYFGGDVSLREVREQMAPGRGGNNAAILMKAGRRFGLRARAVRIPDVADLVQLDPGAILHWRFTHFVVLEALTPGGALIVDPALGRIEVTRRELRKAFTGVALVFQPSSEFSSSKRKRFGFRYLPYVLARKVEIFKLVVTSVGLQLLSLAVPILIGVLVDVVVPGGHTDLLWALSGSMAVVVVAYFTTSLARGYVLLRLRALFDTSLTLDFVGHLVDLPFSFFQARSSGDLIARLGSNVKIRDFLTSGTISALMDGMLAALYLVLIFQFSAPLAWIVMLLAAIRIAGYWATRRRHRELMSEELVTESRARAYEVQMLAGIEVLKSTGTEREAVEQWTDLFFEQQNVILRQGRLDAWFDSFLSSLQIASPLVVLLFGAVQVLNGQISLGALLALNALAVGFLMPLSNLVNTAVQWQHMVSYLERVAEVLDATAEDNLGGAQAARLSGRILAENVSFRYSEHEPLVIQEVSLEIEPGSFVAIVGSSGAGKSTLGRLLLGLYQPTEGCIRYDGMSLSEVDLRSIRRQIGTVTQEPFIFGTSIRANIALADPKIPLWKVMEAARKARLHDEIQRMPMGYDTLVSDGGSTLSGGQRQRLALARAVVADPRILLLDEATSNLDTVVEEEIRLELNRLECTRIVIAHRLSTVRTADRIVVLDQGRIVQEGTHDDLIDQRGKYRDLITGQVGSTSHTDLTATHELGDEHGIEAQV